MDQGKNRMRLIELEEDLEYNISRKEELKKEVRKLKDQYESTYEVYMKNTKVAMDQNVEIADLRAVIEQKDKENVKIQLENDSLKDRVKSLEKEIAQSRTAGKNTPDLQDIESQNKHLKEVIKSKEIYEDKHFIELKDSNKNLKLQVENLLQCNDCENIFRDKAQIYNHIKSEHSVRNVLDFKCDNCDNEFAGQSYLRDHLGKEHPMTRVKEIKCKGSDRKLQLMSEMEKQKRKGHINSSREDILKKENEILKKITTQKINIVNSIHKLKQKEEKQKENCSCRGFCRILHSRFRWKTSKC